MSCLDHDRIQQLQAGWQSTGIPYDTVRNQMLGGIHAGFIGILPTSAVPAAQLMGDLSTMNRVCRLSDGTIPIVMWLQNAVQLTAALEVNGVFRRALADVMSDASGEPVISDAARVPSWERPEAVVHRNDMVSYNFLKKGYEAGRNVAMLRVPRVEGDETMLNASGDPILYLGTGWLLTRTLMITNHHVVNARDLGEPQAQDCDLRKQVASATVQFDYDSDNVQGSIVEVGGLEISDTDLDYAVVRLKSPAPYGGLNMSARRFELDNDPIAVNIIQHPSPGFPGPKRVAIRNNLVYDCEWPDVRYFSDTERGSSGSPVFNDHWEVVALHRASTWVDNVRFQGRTTGVVNVGTQIAAVLEDLERAAPELLKETER